MHPAHGNRASQDGVVWCLCSSRLTSVRRPHPTADTHATMACNGVAPKAPTHCRRTDGREFSATDRSASIRLHERPTAGSSKHTPRHKTTRSSSLRLRRHTTAMAAACSPLHRHSAHASSRAGQARIVSCRRTPRFPERGWSRRPAVYGIA